MTTYNFTAQIEKDPETGLYIGIIPNLPSAHTQAATLDELQKNLHEVAELCVEELSQEELKHLPQFVGLQQISISI